MATDARASVHLEVRGLGKSFGATRALDDVSVEIESGTVHAFVGENGAGKSTLGKIVAGVFPPDQGDLVLRGEPVAFRSPREALERGIAIVAQEVALVPQLTVAQNVFLGAEPRRAGFIDRRAMAERFARLATESGFDLDGRAVVGSLSIAEQQQVEILRSLARQADLIVLDEPTASLSAKETERLHEIVRSLRAGGRTVILVSHFLAEVLALADTVTVLRDGRVVRTGPAKVETENSLVAAMLGRPAARAYPAKQPAPPDSPVVLSIRHLSAPGVQDVSLELRSGEIVGLAGLIGAGRSELARAIYGANPATGGEVRVRLGPSRRHARGVAAGRRRDDPRVPQGRRALPPPSDPRERQPVDASPPSPGSGSSGADASGAGSARSSAGGRIAAARGARRRALRGQPAEAAVRQDAPGPPGRADRGRADPRRGRRLEA